VGQTRDAETSSTTFEAHILMLIGLEAQMRLELDVVEGLATRSQWFVPSPARKSKIDVEWVRNLESKICTVFSVVQRARVYDNETAFSIFVDIK
jgi:hypothetical protein